ncbi:MAG: tetratricopeptide repeat protein [Muribaculaceae bacterium]
MESTKPNTLETTQEEKPKLSRKAISTIAVALIVVIVAGLAVFFVRQNGSNNADELIAKADMEQNDSIALNLYKEAAQAGYASGNRAKAEVAIRLYRDGKYADALKYLEDASADDEIVAAGILSLKGDCLVNLDRTDEALNAYDKAIKNANENPALVPMILIKKANIYRVQKKFAEEFDAYNTIINEYPKFVQSSQTDIRKYYERARIAAGK